MGSLTIYHGIVATTRFICLFSFFLIISVSFIVSVIFTNTARNFAKCRTHVFALCSLIFVGCFEIGLWLFLQKVVLLTRLLDGESLFIAWLVLHLVRNLKHWKSRLSLVFRYLLETLRQRGEYQIVVSSGEFFLRRLSC